MTPQIALDIGRQTLMMVLLVSLPLLAVGLVVGVAISLFQAVTQIQEMTLTFVPKIVAMVLAGILFMPYIITKIMIFATQMFGPMPVP